MFDFSGILPEFNLHMAEHGLRTPGGEIIFIARPKIKSQSQIYRYGRPKHILSATSAQNFRFL